MRCSHELAIRPGAANGEGIETFTVEPIALGMCVACTIGFAPEFSRLVIRYRTDGAAPSTPCDGLPLLDEPASPGSSYRGCHHPLYRGHEYVYTIFGLDDRGTIRASATTAGSPSAE